MEDGNFGQLIPSRPWRVIAQELSQETDPKRVLELSQELNRALEQQNGKAHSPHTDCDSRHPPKPDGKS